MNERCLTLYTRRGCPLCDEMAAALAARLSGEPVRLSIVDVDTQADLKARFGWDVPLLFIGNSEICRHQLDIRALNNWLAKVQ